VTKTKPPTPPASDPVTMVARLENAIQGVARVIATYGEVEYAPLLDRLEKELAYYNEGRDPVSRARAILEKYGQQPGDPRKEP
jgi:hypothetical protein